MNISEKSEELAKWVLEKLLPDGNTLNRVEDQSHGEHDFDIVDKDGNLIGVVEVTLTAHEESMCALARNRNHGPIKCENMKQDWLLMAHNPDPRWIKENGCKHLAALVSNGMTTFSYNDRYSPVREIADAVRSLIENGIENGQQTDGTEGTIRLLMSSGEDNEPYIISSKGVAQALMTVLEKPDNSAKLSKEKYPCHYSRHLFVVIDRITQPGEFDSMVQGSPPSTSPDLESRATHIWAAIRQKHKIIVWCGDTIEWKQWCLNATNI